MENVRDNIMGELIVTEEIIDYILKLLVGDVKYRYLISYGEEKGQELICIKPSFFFEKGIYKTKKTYPQIPLKEWEGIPILFGEDNSYEKNGRLTIEADLVASSFFLLTRYEELINDDNRDKHKRFIGKGSVMGKCNFLDRPIVDEYSKKIRELLKGKGIPIENKEGISHVYLTHDVDLPWKNYTLGQSIKETIKTLLYQKRINFSPIFNSFGFYKYNQYDTFDWLIELDKRVKNKYGDQCDDVYFIIANMLETSMTPSYLQDNKSEKLLNKLKSSAKIIGLHMSYESGIDMNNGKVYSEKKALEERLGEEIKSNRNHYLIAKDIEDLTTLLEIGIREDFTMGYADIPGFRLGTSKTVRWIDPEQMKLTDLYLHPLIIMDNSLCEKQYLGLDKEVAWNTIEHFINIVESVNGELCVLFHNSTIKIGEYTWLSEIYERLIARLVEKGAQ